jgi:hypothetical protein
VEHRGERHRPGFATREHVDDSATGGTTLVNRGLNHGREVVARIDSCPIKSDDADVLGDTQSELFRRTNHADSEQVALRDDASRPNLGVRQQVQAGAQAGVDRTR